MIRLTRYFYFATIIFCVSLLIIVYWPSDNSTQAETVKIHENVLHEAQLRSERRPNQLAKISKPVQPRIQNRHETQGSGLGIEVKESAEEPEPVENVEIENYEQSMKQMDEDAQKEHIKKNPLVFQTTKAEIRKVIPNLLHLKELSTTVAPLHDATTSVVGKEISTSLTSNTRQESTKVPNHILMTTQLSSQEIITESSTKQPKGSQNRSLDTSATGEENMYISTTSAILDNSNQNLSDHGGEGGATKCGNELMSMPAYLDKKLIKYGKAFSCDLVGYLDGTGLSGTSTEEVKEFKSEDVVYVTYSSANHYYESKLALMMLRNISINKIIYYDIGLAEEQIKELKTFCNLEYRLFNFSRYPPFVKHLMTYSFKPILIAEIYKEYPVFWFIDASTHFYEPVKLEEFYRDSSNNKYGKFIGRSPTGHSIHTATNPGMYEYLPIDEKLRRKANMFAAWMFVLRSPLSREAVKWNFLCALTQDCIAPQGAKLGCYWVDNNWFGEYAKCHRFDQSSINIVLNNLFEKYDARPPKEGSEFGEFFKVQRTASYKAPLPVGCQNNT